MVNIRQVAEKAGVSVATVSRVLNEHDSVKKDTKIKVQQAIKALNYKPSLLGRNLRKAQSKLMLLIIPEIANPYYFEIIKGVESMGLRYDYNILLCETGSDPKREDTYFDLVRSRMADGIISMDPALNVEKLKKLAKEFAIVQCSEYDEKSGIPFVTIDHEKAAYDAVNHLIELGHQNILFINSDEKFLYARQREAGYRRALQENKVSIQENNLINTGGLSFQLGQQAMASVLNRKQVPTAVFAVSDLLAIGALKATHQAHLSVPEDIAIMGFDKIEFSDMTHPVLSTVKQPMYEMGEIVAKMLIDHLHGKETQSVILKHQVIKRTSTTGVKIKEG